MQSIPPTPLLRGLIDQILLGDSDLEAFVLDHFPEVKRLYGGSMDRTTKVNLLLERIDHERIYTNLCQRDTGAEVRKATAINDRQNNGAAAKVDKRTVRYFLVLTGTIDQIDEPKLKALMNHIKKISGDAELSLEALKPGSIVLHLKGTPEGLTRLRRYRADGQLRNILEYPLECIGVEDDPIGPLPVDIDTDKHRCFGVLANIKYALSWILRKPRYSIVLFFIATLLTVLIFFDPYYFLKKPGMKYLNSDSKLLSETDSFRRTGSNPTIRTIPEEGRHSVFAVPRLEPVEHRNLLAGPVISNAKKVVPPKRLSLKLAGIAMDEANKTVRLILRDCGADQFRNGSVGVYRINLWSGRFRVINRDACVIEVISGSSKLVNQIQVDIKITLQFDDNTALPIRSPLIE